MEAPIIIEILDRFGKVKERHKVSEFPLKIGRSYKNDIIVDDNYVSPEHIEMMLDGDGHILVNDLHSDNGMFTLHPLVRHDILTLKENQRIRQPNFLIKDRVVVGPEEVDGVFLSQRLGMVVGGQITNFCQTNRNGIGRARRIDNI